MTADPLTNRDARVLPTYAGRMDELEFAAQPHCPSCGVVMRTERDAFVCPSCGHLLPLDEAGIPPEFEGPSIGGG